MNTETNIPAYVGIDLTPRDEIPAYVGIDLTPRDIKE